jgi:hypothetical protein
VAIPEPIVSCAGRPLLVLSGAPPGSTPEANVLGLRDSATCCRSRIDGQRGRVPRGLRYETARKARRQVAGGMRVVAGLHLGMRRGSSIDIAMAAGLRSGEGCGELGACLGGRRALASCIQDGSLAMLALDIAVPSWG